MGEARGNTTTKDINRTMTTPVIAMDTALFRRRRRRRRQPRQAMVIMLSGKIRIEINTAGMVVIRSSIMEIPMDPLNRIHLVTPTTNASLPIARINMMIDTAPMGRADHLKSRTIQAIRTDIDRREIRGQRLPMLTEHPRVRLLPGYGVLIGITY